MTNTIAHVFIPRTLVFVTKKMVKDVFENQNIGKVIYIDIYSRKNEYKHTYNFAFLKIRLYHNKNADDFMEKLKRMSYVNVHYSQENPSYYWEVKNRIPYSQRTQKQGYPEPNNTKIPLPVVMVNEMNLPYKVGSCFTKKDIMDMEKDYLELEREIYGNNYISVAN